MPKKPTYEELKNKVNELEHGLFKLQKGEEGFPDKYELLLSLLEHSQDFILLSDENGYPVLFNSAYKQLIDKLLGIEMKAGIKPHKLLPYDETVKWWDSLHQRVLNGETFRVEYSHQLEDARKMHFEISYTPLIENGKVNGFSEITRDITASKQAEEALREKEEYYRALIEHASDGIAVLDAEGLVTYTSPSYRRILGYELEEQGVSRFTDNVHPDDIPMLADLFSQLLKNPGGTERIEVRVQHKNGNWLFIEAAGRNLLNNSTVAGIVVNFYDMTDRKLAGEELRTSEVRFQTAIDSLPFSFFLLGANGRYEMQNSFCKECWGDVIGKRPKDVAPNKEILVLWEDNNRRAFSGEVVQGEVCLNTDGEEFLIHNTIVPIWEDGQVRGVLGVNIDITQRKKAQEALLESEDKFSRIFESSPIGMVITTLSDGRIINLNRSFTKITGYSQQSVLNSSSLEMGFWLTPEDREKVTQLLREAGSVTDQEISFRKKSGEIGQALISSVTVNIEDNQCIATALQDITEARRSEEEKAVLEEKLGRAKRMESLGLLAGGVAHDLNNILSGVVTLPETLMMDDGLPADIRDSMEIIRESGERAAAVVADLLTVCRGIGGGKVPVQLNHLIQQVLQSPECLRLRRTYPNIKFVTDLDQDLWHIHASALHISKSLVNLLFNATESIEDQGTVTITTRNQVLERPRKGYEDIPAGEYVVLRVSDTGGGVSREDMDRIFEPFYTRKMPGRSGTGLGLTVVWNTLRDHGGSIDLSSTQDGTTFSFYLPMTGDPLSSEEINDSLQEMNGNGETILVVDDDQGQRTITTDLLKRLNYRAVAVRSGEEAVEYLKEKKVDLIILDMVMDPGISGRRTYELIIQQNPDQKAIITSGYSETVDVRETQKLGAGAYIKKPFALKKIAAAIRESLHG